VPTPPLFAKSTFEFQSAGTGLGGNIRRMRKSITRRLVAPRRQLQRDRFLVTQECGRAVAAKSVLQQT
jgi:hypothetical protein